MSIEHEQELRGGCYCGEVRFLVPGGVSPLLAGYCHCASCRHAHAAPLYQVAWIPTEDFTITEGHALLKWYTRSTVTREHLRRYFCVNCGTKVFNAYEGPFGGQAIKTTGLFPSLFDDQTLARSEHWAPRLHMHCEDSLMDVALFNDGLPKLAKGADGG